MSFQDVWEYAEEYAPSGKMVLSLIREGNEHKIWRLYKYYSRCGDWEVVDDMKRVIDKLDRPELLKEQSPKYDSSDINAEFDEPVKVDSYDNDKEIFLKLEQGRYTITLTAAVDEDDDEEKDEDDLEEQEKENEEDILFDFVVFDAYDNRIDVGLRCKNESYIEIEEYDDGICKIVVCPKSNQDVEIVINER